MKVSLAQVFTIIERAVIHGTPSALRCILYGPNIPLMHALLEEIKQQWTWCQIFVEDEMLQPAVSLFEAPPQIHIADLTNIKNPNPLITRWDSGPLVIMATNCSPDLQKDRDIVTAPCYECTLPESHTILKRYSQRHNLVFTSDAQAFCAQFCQENSWASVCHMLQLYQAPSITVDVLEALFPHLSSNLEKILISDMAFQWQYLEIIEPMRAIRLWQKLILQAYQLASLSLNKGIEQALSQLRPFFKHIPFIKKYAHDPRALERALRILLKAEVEIKKNPSMAVSVLQRCLQAQRQNWQPSRVPSYQVRTNITPPVNPAPKAWSNNNCPG